MAIRSGFFSAVKTGNVYDRVYNSDDHNNFLKGTVAQNGVFRNIKGCLYATTFQEHVDNVEIDGEIYNDRIQVIFNPGKAMVNGHWFVSDAEESVYLSPRPLGTGYRVDMISLRFNDGDRTVSFHVTEGSITNTKPVEANYPVPIGYISDPVQKLKDEGYSDTQIKLLTNENGKLFDSDFYFEPVTDEQTSDQVLEIALAYVTVPANVTEAPITIETRQGSTVCPWISFVSGYYPDSFVAQYTQDILEWWYDIKREGGIEPVMNKIKKRFAGGANRSSTILFSEIPGYIYEGTDDFSIFYNGLYVDETEWEFHYDGDTKDGIKLHNGSTIIPVDNSVVIEIYKGQSIEIPDANDYRY